jgi:SAM-dependent methyltransferase
MDKLDSEIVEREKQYWNNIGEFDWLTPQSIRLILSGCLPIDGDVLELCSGTGMFTRSMPRTFRSYTCLDISAARLTRLGRALPDLTLVQGDAHKLAFADCSFDRVCVFAGLHHLPNYQMAINESYRVLRPHGHFVCFEPNARCWYRRVANPVRRMTGLFTEDEVFLDPSELAENFSSAGFIRVESEYTTPRYDEDFLGNLLNRLLARLVYAAAQISLHHNSQAFVFMTARKPGLGDNL